MISEEACLTINILLLHRKNSTRKARSRERYKGTRLSASKFKVLPPLPPPPRGRIKLTLQQATTCAPRDSHIPPPFLFFRQKRRREKEMGGRQETMHRLPPHISYTLLHFLNMTRAAPRDSTRSRCFRTLLVEGESVALLWGDGEGEARFEGLRAKHHSICKISRVAEAK